MMLETVLGYKSSWRVLGLLSETPAKPIARTDIKRYTQLGNEAVNQALKRLVLANILVKEKRGKKEAYYINLSDEVSKRLLELLRAERAHLKNISFDVMLVLNEFGRKVIEKTTFVSGIFLFGSVAKGIARANSDIDVALIISKKDIRQELIITHIADSVSKQFKRKIQVHYCTEYEFANSKSALLGDIRNEGIILFRHLNAKRI
ncbi:MAG: nucleotidyltransferase domain-containing protein [Nanoarchaeota archaeon]|nr:nucleotidyltransferase domain-containing protein [Nanoarchaeota archaeon]